MPDRLALLERIADLARYMRELEKGLAPADEPRKVMTLLIKTRQKLDEALEDLARLERER